MSKEQGSESAVSGSQFIKEGEMAEEKEEPKEVSRREFVKGAALGAAAVAGAGALASCAPAPVPTAAPGETAAPAPTCPPAAECPTPWLPETWDYETDVVVVGAGGAGVAAAWEAANANAEVIVLEKAAKGGGSSFKSGGYFAMLNTPLQEAEGITDSAESLVADMETAVGEYFTRDLAEAHAEGALHVYDWLEGLGVAPTRMTWQGGHTVARSHMIDSPGVWTAVYEDAITKGAEVLLETPGRELIADPEGRVIGVKAESEGETIYVKARRAVVITSGGFLYNQDMMLNYGGPGKWASCVLAPDPTDTGDGILMAQAVGGNLRNMSTAVKPGSPKNPKNKIAVNITDDGAIVVNAEGERIGDESIEHHSFPGLFQLQQTRALGWEIYDAKILAAHTFIQPPLYVQGQQHIYAIEADTIEELAEKIEVPAETLKQTIEKYNSDIDEFGYDTVFGRTNLMIGPPARGELVKIDTPPFSAIETYPSLTSSAGGTRINGKAQVLHVLDGEGIPGLYAAGETAVAVSFMGCAVGGAYIFGRIAGVNAAAEEPWE